MSNKMRELCRKKGQFWTPDWIADVMVMYALQKQPSSLLDPALGEGVFFRTAKRYSKLFNFNLTLFGRDVDEQVLSLAKLSGLTDNDLKNVEIKDFVLEPPDRLFPSIVVNPPYIRHHHLTITQKKSLQNFVNNSTGLHIDGRAGLHVYFLIRALLSLEKEGYLSFIVSADICEGVFSKKLWQWVCANYCLETVITFSPEASPFPGIDTNAIVFLIKNAKPNSNFNWIKCFSPQSKELIKWLLTKKTPTSSNKIKIVCRSLQEALNTGLSRPKSDDEESLYKLGDFATVMRGVVTGDNNFFFLTKKRIEELHLPDSFFIRALGRTRDVEGDSFDLEDLQNLEITGRPSYLLNIGNIPYTQLPSTVQNYLTQGELIGLPTKALISTRKPWYRLETRKIPPILFAYLGRRNTRFILNRANVTPLTCLLCIYPRISSPTFLESLWKVLSNQETIENLKKVGKSYGNGAIKVEPRALEQLPLPNKIVQSSGLDKNLSSYQQGLLSLSPT